MFREISTAANTLTNTLTNTHTHTHTLLQCWLSLNQGQGLPKASSSAVASLSGYRAIVCRSTRSGEVARARVFVFFSSHFLPVLFLFFVIVFLFYVPIYFWPPPQFVVVVTVLCPFRRLVTVDRKTSAIAEHRLAKHSFGFCQKANDTRDLRAKIHQIFWKLQICFFFGFTRFPLTLLFF